MEVFSKELSSDNDEVEQPVYAKSCQIYANHKFHFVVEVNVANDFDDR